MAVNIGDAISAYSRISGGMGIDGADKVGAKDGTESGFAAVLRAGVEKAIDSQYHSEKVSADAVIGKASMTDVVQAVNDAELTLNTVVAIRDKIIEAYKQIMQMPV